MDITTIPGMGFDSNIYIVKGKRPILVDTGTGQNAERDLKRIRESGLAEAIERIVLTHRHCDHAGGAAFLAEALGANILAPPREAAALRDAGSSTGALAFGIPMGPIEVGDLGERVDLGDAVLEVIETPGHTDGSVCLWHAESRRLICGDTVFAGGGVGRWDLETGNYDQLLASVKMLAGMDIDAFYPGHGPSAERDANRQVAMTLKYLKDCASWR